MKEKYSQMLKCTSHAAKARSLKIWKWSFYTSENNTFKEAPKEASGEEKTLLVLHFTSLIEFVSSPVFMLNTGQKNVWNHAVIFFSICETGGEKSFWVKTKIDFTPLQPHVLK